MNFKFSFFPFLMMVVISIGMFSCKQDGAADKVDPNVIDGVVFDPLPFACDIIKSTKMASILTLEESTLELLDGNRGQTNSNSTSCFYKWNDAVYDDSGVFIQVQRNPVPDELADYVQVSMNNKKFEGERSYDDPNQRYLYQDFTGISVPAIVNRENTRYYFTKGNKYLYSVAFNYPVPAEKMDALFIEIATEMMKNF